MAEAERRRAITRRELLRLGALGAATAALAGCGGDGSASGDDQAETEAATASDADAGEFSSLAIDMRSWSYDDEHDVYYQMGLPYCKSPVSELYQTLSIFVPGPFFEATEHGRYYTCKVARGVKVGQFASTGAPLVIALNAGDFAAQDALTTYTYTDALGSFLEQGMIYVYPGLRGRSSGYDSTTDTLIPGGIPYGLVDLKATVRFLRYNDADMAGSANRIVTMGHGAGGTLSVLAGATGGSTLFTPYLDDIGAITHDASGEDVSDDVWASLSWCPVIFTDGADAAYEWAVGQYDPADSSRLRPDGSFERRLSRDLADLWADHVDERGMEASTGGTLELQESDDAEYSQGSYASYVRAELESSFADFATRTSFPFTQDLSGQLSAGFPGADDDASLGAAGDSLSASSTPEGEVALEGETFASLDEYLAALNAQESWLTYDVGTGSASVASLGAFARACRPATRGLGAFDALDRSWSTNQLFGVGQDSESLHFDKDMGTLLSENEDEYKGLVGWDSSYPGDWEDDLDQVDGQGSSITRRAHMYDPFYFVAKDEKGYGTTQVAPHWRINSGVQQDSTTLVQEMDLSLCLSAIDGVRTCDLTLVWERGFAPAERVGELPANVASWLAACYLR
jgi:hypothetical protein